MKRFVKYIINFSSKILALALNKSLTRAVSFLITRINTQCIARQLKRCGEHPNIMFPITSNGLENISIGNNFNIGARARLETYSKHLENNYHPEMIIGDNVNIGYDCHIGCVNNVYVGNNVLMASKIFITDHFHGDTSKESLSLPPNLRDVISKGPVVIEDNVWIGEGVAIMPNVTIGRNSIIGANSVVTKNIPENSVAAGNPAKVIKNMSVE